MAARVGGRGRHRAVAVARALALAGALVPGGAAGARTISIEERAAWERARPVFEEQCFSCHTTRGEQRKRKALRHLNMDRYPFTGHHTHDLTRTIREVLGATGEEPTMPSDDPGAVKGDDLARVLAWADAVDRAAGGAKRRPPGHHHEHGPEGQGAGAAPTRNDPGLADAARAEAPPPPPLLVALLEPVRGAAAVAILAGVLRVGAWLLGAPAPGGAPRGDLR